MTTLLTRLRRRSDVRVVGIFIIVFAGLVIISPSAAVSPGAVFARASVNGLVALGLTVVIVQGAFDLSVGSTLALGAIITAQLSQNVGLSVIAALGAGLGIGIINGVIVAVLGINSFIATIATASVLQGVDYYATNTRPIEGHNLDTTLRFVSPLVSFITPEMLIFIGATLVVHVFLSRTAIGREFYAVGGSQAAARATGIPVKRRIVQGFAVCGIFAALAGWVTGIQSNSANPNQGNGIALLGIAAVVVGGASLKGGAGTAIGTAIAAIMLAGIGSTFDAVGISTLWQDVTYGAILLFVVVANSASGGYFILKSVLRAIAPSGEGQAS